MERRARGNWNRVPWAAQMRLLRLLANCISFDIDNEPATQSIRAVVLGEGLCTTLFHCCKLLSRVRVPSTFNAMSVLSGGTVHGTDSPVLHFASGEWAAFRPHDSEWITVGVPKTFWTSHYATYCSKRLALEHRAQAISACERGALSTTPEHQDNFFWTVLLK